jgi:oligopeptide/dipeptide ABC transporter ATP-binding protein
VVDDVSFGVPSGGTLGIVGESGSGKSMTSLAIMGVLPRSAKVDSGAVIVDGRDTVTASPAVLRELRGSTIGMVLQDSMTALDPCFTIGHQIGQPLRNHRGLRGEKLTEATIASMEQVELPSDRHRLKQYPHQFSGGMRQRVVSAIALAGRPGILIADEPTTAMDVITQARYLRLLRQLRDSSDFALVLVTHDLLIVRHMCEQIVVMYAGQIVETGTAEQMFQTQLHPYTRALLGAIPLLGQGKARLQTIPGNAPEAGAASSGCRFASRCPFAREKCTVRAPELTPREGARSARCWGTEPGGWITP